MTMLINRNNLLSYISLLKGCGIMEARFVFGEGMVSCCEIDPTKSEVISIKIPKEEFSNYVPNIVLSIDVEAFIKIIKATNKEKDIGISKDMGGNGIRLTDSGGGTSLNEINVSEEERRVPMLTGEELLVNAGKLADTVGRLDGISVRACLKSYKNRLYVASGNGRNSKTMCRHIELEEGMEAIEENTACYSFDLLNPVLKELKSGCENIKIILKNDFPLKITGEYNKAIVLYILAPMTIEKGEIDFEFGEG